MTEELNSSIEAERKQIDWAALTPIENLAMGSGVDFAKSDGTKIRITQNVLLDTVRQGTGFINEDYSVPIGLINGELTPEQVMEERKKFPTIKGMFAMGLFEPNGAGDLVFDDGFEPELHLSTENFLDQRRWGVEPSVLQLTFANKNPDRKLTQADIDKIQLNSGMDELFNFVKPTVENPVGIISVNPRAIYGETTVA